MCVAMFYIAIWLICGESKEPKTDDFGTIFVELSIPRWQTISKFNIMCGNNSNLYWESCNHWNLTITVLPEMNQKQSKLTNGG